MQCTIKNLSIHYEIIGEGKPIIMIHGYYPDHRLMTGCMEPIFKTINGYKRIYIDLPGMGKSESDEWITSSDNMLDILIEFIEKIIPSEDFLLVGESYGGYLSRGLLYKIPNRVLGMTLICPLIIPEYSKRSVPEHVVLVKDTKLLSTLSPEDADDFNSCLVVQNQKIYERYRNEIMSGVEIANSTFLQKLMKNGYSFSFDVDKLDKKFDKPALILLGKQDSCVGYKDAWSILDNFPRATFCILDKAGHTLQIEQEELFNSLVSEWLLRSSEF